MTMYITKLVERQEISGISSQDSVLLKMTHFAANMKELSITFQKVLSN